MAVNPGLLHTFLAESEELVAALERGLMDLERAPTDTEVLGGLFRAAHTFKGNAGLVGLTEIVEFAHVQESVLDRLRSLELRADPPLVSALLASVDVLREMARRVASGEDLAATPGLEPAQEALESFMAVGPSSAGASGGKERVLAISLVFRANPFERGQEPALLLRELAGLGALLEVVPRVDLVPPLEGLEPEHLYLEWNVKLRTRAPLSEVQGVFLFVEDASGIVIDEVAEHGAAVVTPAGGDGRRAGKVAQSGSMRVDTSKVDKLVNLVGEMVIALAQVGRASRDARLAHEARVQVVEALERIGRELQDHVMSLRMVPIEETFNRFQRAVRDLAREQQKEIVLELSGTDTEIDKNVLDQLVDPLKHMVRNCIAHGIESPDERRRAGKPAEGHIRLSAEQRGGHIRIEVADDGRGVDPARVLAKAKERGLLPPEATPSTEAIYELLFLPGFSTAEAVDELSGRGVGLDVVRQNVLSLRGTVSVESVPGRGTQFIVTLPLSLAILEGMNVRVGRQLAVIPLLSVVELLEAATARVETLEGRGELLRLGERHVPLVRLREVLDERDGGGEEQAGAASGHSSSSTVVVVEASGRRFALLADQVLGVEQAVLKPLAQVFAPLDGGSGRVRPPDVVAGATILGDGSLGLILDVHGLERTAIGGNA